MTELHALARISSAPAPAVTRIVFTEEDTAARALLRSFVAQLDLQVRIDAIGNTFIRWTGREPALPAVATGSHIDAIPNAGMYDGTVGVLGGLEAIRALREAGHMPRRSIELILFTTEEPTRFGIGCTGSRAMAGVLPGPRLAALVDSQGVTFDRARGQAGFAGDLESVAVAPGRYHAFIELHIEQGPRLEAARLPIGIVTAIAAPATLDVTLEGEGGHAGGVMMRDRKDALTAACETVLLLERLARAAGDDTVGTCGLVRIEPGAVNSIPFRATLTLDIRDIDGSRRDRLIADFTREATRLARQRDVGIAFHTRNADPPASCDGAIIDAIVKSCDETGTPAMKLVSRAYHDCLFMARLAPVGMIFIPCRGGVSHRPDEYASPEHITAGVEVLARSLARLAC